MSNPDFDEQAPAFDRRAGLPEFAAELIARMIARLGDMHARDVLLEIGAGTGLIGAHLCGLPGRYVGFDTSAAMLEIFARKARARGISATLMEADGRDRWPVDDRSVKTFFGSRVLHLLPVDHVMAEIFRASGSTGSTLIIGRVQRSPDGMRSRLRREMRERVRNAGFHLAEGRDVDTQIFASLRARGAGGIDPVVAAAWPVSDSAGEIIESWATKKELAGVDLPAAAKSAILRGLEAWSEENFGSAGAIQSSEEKYVLEGVRLPPD